MGRLDAGLFSELSWKNMEHKQGDKRGKARDWREDSGYGGTLFKNSG